LYKCPDRVPNTPRFSPSSQIRVVLASRTIVSYVSVWRATTRALVELGCSAFFIAGVAWIAIGPSAPYFVLAAAALSIAVRAVDIESRALFVPGGLYGSVRDTLGRLPARFAAAASFVERLMLGPVAAVVAGHYFAAMTRAVFGVIPGGPAGLTGDDGTAALAVVLLGIVWWLQRQARVVSDRALSQAVLSLTKLWCEKSKRSLSPCSNLRMGESASASAALLRSPVTAHLCNADKALSSDARLTVRLNTSP
jgi:hypothetical protein